MYEFDKIVYPEDSAFNIGSNVWLGPTCEKCFSSSLMSQFIQLYYVRYYCNSQGRGW